MLKLNYSIYKICITDWLFGGICRYESIIGSTQLHVLLMLMTILKHFLKRNRKLSSAERCLSLFLSVLCVYVCNHHCSGEHEMYAEFALGEIQLGVAYEHVRCMVKLQIWEFFYLLRIALTSHWGVFGLTLK